MNALSPALPSLAPREAETLRYLAQGCTYRQAARRMSVTTPTVNTYLGRIKTKFGITNRSELIQLALRLQLL